MGCAESYFVEKDIQSCMQRVSKENLILKRKQIKLNNEVMCLRMRIVELCDTIDDELIPQIINTNDGEQSLKM